MSEPFMKRLPKGSDLLEAITAEFKARSVTKGTFTLIGALSHAVLGYYDQAARQYFSKEFEGEFEIAACMGNVSMKDGDIFVHAHAVISGSNYACAAGHLMPGSIVFAAELSAMPVPGADLLRDFDEETGLALWKQS